MAMKPFYVDLIVGAIGLTITIAAVTWLYRSGAWEKLDEIKTDLADFYMPDVLKKGETQHDETIAKTTDSEGPVDNTGENRPEAEADGKPE